MRTVLQRDVAFFMMTPAFIWQLLFLYIPFLLVVGLSITQIAGEGLFTTSHYTVVLDPLFYRVIARSLVLALCNALLCVVVAFPVAYYVACHVQRNRQLWLFFLMLPFWINFLVQAYAWFFVLEKNGLLNSVLCKLGIITTPLSLLNTPFAIYLVMVYCYLPFALMPLYTALEKFDKRLLEASADLGATAWQTFTRVTLPLSARGIRTAFFLVLVPSFGEFIVPTLLGGGKQLYVGSLISHYFLSIRNFNVGAAFTSMSGFILILVALIVYGIFSRLIHTKKVVH